MAPTNLDLRLDPLYTIALFAVIVAAATRLHRSRPIGPMVWRAGLGVILALGTAAAVEAVLAYHTYHPWQHSGYLAGLLPFTAALAWAALLFRSELVQVATRLGERSLLLPLATLALAATLLVSGADLALLWLGRVTSAPWRSIPLAPWAWAFNVALLLTAFLLAFGLTARLGLALLLVAPPYVALTAATMGKLTYMQTAVQPLDVLRLPEFLPLFPQMFGRALAVITAAAVGLWLGALVVAHRRERARLGVMARAGLAVGALAALLAVPLAYAASADAPRLEAWLMSVGGPAGQFKDQTKRNGLLLSFLSELPSLAIRPPAGYDAAAVRRVAARYEAPTPSPAPGPRINLVIYLVESLMDPRELGLRYTAEPVPNLRALLQSHIGGHAIVPGLFGGSANTEFELLTGMSMAFLPRESLPYRQYLRRPIPALPSQLKRLGYHTTAVQPDPRFYYDRERAYRLLGFDRVVWLDDVPDIERDRRVGWPADHTVVQAIIEASRSAEPFFIFAFPASTHAYYRSGKFRDSRLAPVPPPAGDSAGEVQEYINALHIADREIGALVRYFAGRPDSTVIAVLGDHLPPLSGGAFTGFHQAMASAPEAERDWRMRRVPLLVWSSFPLKPERPTLSVNALPSYLLEKLGLPGFGILAATDTIRRRLPVLGRQGGSDGDRTWRLDSLPAPLDSMIRDYRLLQYDLLLGGQHTLPTGFRSASGDGSGTASNTEGSDTRTPLPR